MERSRVIPTLLALTLLNFNCIGWSVAGWELNENSYTYVEILDSDSTQHIYEGLLKLDLDNWCLIHRQFEKVEKQ